METNAMRTFIIVTATSLMVLVLLPTSIDAILFVVFAKFDYEVCHSTVRERIPLSDYQCDVTHDVLSLAFIHGKNFQDAC
jgi:hypothetical protein